MKLGSFLALTVLMLSAGAPELYAQDPIIHKVSCGSIRIGVTSMDGSDRGVEADCAPLEAAQPLAYLNRAQPRVTVTSVVSERSSPLTGRGDGRSGKHDFVNTAIAEWSVRFASVS
jgi:hypothetical protein